MHVHLHTQVRTIMLVEPGVVEARWAAPPPFDLASADVVLRTLVAGISPEDFDKWRGPSHEGRGPRKTSQQPKPLGHTSVCEIVAVGAALKLEGDAGGGDIEFTPCLQPGDLVVVLAEALTNPASGGAVQGCQASFLVLNQAKEALTD